MKTLVWILLFSFFLLGAGERRQVIIGTDKDSRYSGIDGSTEAQIILDYEHYEVHAGTHFFFADGITLNSGDTQDYLLTAPDVASFCHTVFIFNSGLGATFSLSEGADRDGTTLQSVPNSNRNSSTIAGCTIHKGISGGTTDGTVLAKFSAGSASVGGKIGGGARSEEEVVLKRDTKYVFTATSSVISNNISIFFTWYEHLDKN